MQNRIFKITIDVTKEKLMNLSSITEDLIEIEHKGYLISKDTSGFKAENTSYFVNMISKLKEPTKSEITGKKFYRYPEINIPRDKFNILKEKYNCKLVKDVQSSDYQIISFNTFKSFIEGSGYERVVENHSKFKKQLDQKKHLFDDLAYSKLVSFIDTVNKDDIIWFNTVPNYYHGLNLSSYISNFRSDVTDYCNFYYATCENSKKMDDIIANGSLVIDKHMYKYADQHMHTLNEEDYRNIIKMITASNDDRELAINVLANSNIKESYDKIALICYFFNDQLKETKGYNSAGFKVLRKEFSEFFTNANWSSSYSYNYFIDKLHVNKSLTEFAFKESVSLFFKHVLSNMLGGYRGEKVFDIDINAIKLAPQYQIMIDKGQYDKI